MYYVQVVILFLSELLMYKIQDLYNYINAGGNAKLHIIKKMIFTNTVNVHTNIGNVHTNTEIIFTNTDNVHTNIANVHTNNF